MVLALYAIFKDELFKGDFLVRFEESSWLLLLLRLVLVLLLLLLGCTIQVVYFIIRIVCIRCCFVHYAQKG